MIDSHLHLVNFLQQPLPAKALAEAVTSGDAERLVVFGMPVKKQWAIAEPVQPTYYLDDNAPCGTYSLRMSWSPASCSRLTGQRATASRR